MSKLKFWDNNLIITWYSFSLFSLATTSPIKICLKRFLSPPPVWHCYLTHKYQTSLCYNVSDKRLWTTSVATDYWLFIHEAENVRASSYNLVRNYRNYKETWPPNPWPPLRHFTGNAAPRVSSRSACTSDSLLFILKRVWAGSRPPRWRRGGEQARRL